MTDVFCLYLPPQRCNTYDCYGPISRLTIVDEYTISKLLVLKALEILTPSSSFLQQAISLDPVNLHSFTLILRTHIIRQSRQQVKQSMVARR